MLVTPLFFSTNLIFGRFVVDEVAPFSLAFLRWASVAVALSPFLLRERDAARRVLRTDAALVALLGVLGMWICGAIVYLALDLTTATNGTLIYTTSPVIILLIEAMFRGRRIGRREVIGSVVAFVGVAVIVLRGDLDALLTLDVNAGDLLFAGTAVAWAVYSILYRSPRLAPLSNLALFAAVAGAGALTLLPFAAAEFLLGQAMPRTASAWGGIAGIVVFSSLLAFSGFQYGVRRLGPSAAGVFMYLLPLYGVLLAVTFLGERFHAFHMAGIALVVGGIALATAPAVLFRGRVAR
ncbi:MAG TPA: DMT family transporter [Rhizobiales bacterium]|nr:DMT family transporter [Hyphomicrobiales bacterium]